jgi:hypothetical protein
VAVFGLAGALSGFQHGPLKVLKSSASMNPPPRRTSNLAKHSFAMGNFQNFCKL